MVKKKKERRVCGSNKIRKKKVFIVLSEVKVKLETIEICGLFLRDLEGVLSSVDTSVFIIISL